MSENHRRIREIIETNSGSSNDKIARIVQKETRRVHSSAEIMAYREHTENPAGETHGDNHYLSGRNGMRASLLTLATITVLGLGTVAIDYLKSPDPSPEVQDYLTAKDMVFLDSSGQKYTLTPVDIESLLDARVLPDLLRMYEAQQDLHRETAESFRQSVHIVEQRARETHSLELKMLLTDAVRSMYHDPLSRRALQH